MTTPHEPYTERHLSLVREAEGADARQYCPPLDAPMRPMSVQQRHASPYGITDANAPRVLKAIFEDDAERKEFGTALIAFACLMGGFVALVYGGSWLVKLLTQGA